MNSEKIDEKIQQSLLSGNTVRVMAAVEQITIRGNRLYIPVLFDVLLTNSDPEVLIAVTDLLATVKDKLAVNSFIRGIESEKYMPIRKIILSCCWQNGLDFSTFLPIFIDIITTNDWETAFEAFTVVDNFEFLPSVEIVNSSLIKIHEALPAVNEQTKYFLNEIVKKIGG